MNEKLKSLVENVENDLKAIKEQMELNKDLDLDLLVDGQGGTLWVQPIILSKLMFCLDALRLELEAITRHRKMFPELLRRKG